MNRYRLSTQTATASGSETHLSSVLSQQEADDMLQVEEMLHHARGWDTTQYDDLLVCVKSDVVRTIAVVVRDPFTDPVASC